MAVLSWEQIAAVARQAGWPASDAIVAVAITQPEAGRDSSAIQQGVAYAEQGWGLWQITPGDSEPQFGIDNAMLDPLNNARAALVKFQTQGGFQPWTTFVNGLEQPYLTQAAQGVQAAYALSPAALASAVNGARTATGGAAIGAPTASDWSVHVSATAAAHRRTSAHWANGAAATLAIKRHWDPPPARMANPAETLVRPERI